MKNIIFCPRCGKEHLRAYETVDEFIACDCGYSFYSFLNHGLRITMDSGEAKCSPVASAMRRFVVSTGRCLDIDENLYREGEKRDCLHIPLPEWGSEDALAQAIEEFQIAAFGECFLTLDVLISICESFQDGHDIELKRQKDRTDLIELKKKKVQKRNYHPVSRGINTQMQNMRLAILSGCETSDGHLMTASRSG